MEKLHVGARLIAFIPAYGFMIALAVHTSPSTTEFQNVRMIDGKVGVLSPPSYALVRGNLIEHISSTAIETSQSSDIVFIEGEGRTLMPGLIDAHWHAYWCVRADCLACAVQ